MFSLVSLAGVAVTTTAFRQRCAIRLSTSSSQLRQLRQRRVSLILAFERLFAAKLEDASVGRGAGGKASGRSRRTGMVKGVSYPAK